MPRASKAHVWTGRALSGIVLLFMTLDGVTKLARVPAVVEASEQMGITPGALFAIGATALGCTILYAIPRTAALGAILLTGFLGGAVATHVRLGNPLLSHTLFPTYLGAMAWAGLVLRRPELRALLGLAGGRGPQGADAPAELPAPLVTTR